MLDLSNDHDTFIFLVYEQYLSFENRLSTIYIRAKVCHVTDNEIYDVSKSASEICPDKEIGRRQNLSWYKKLKCKAKLSRSRMSVGVSVMV